MALPWYRRPALERRRIMWFSSWLRNRNGSGARERRRRHRAPRKRATYGLRVEALEDRWLPSTLTVLNNNDSGPHSLRAEIAAAQTGDTIHFAGKLGGQTITLTSGQLLVNKSLDIEWLGTGALIVSGNQASRVFDIQGNVTVTISGLTIANGLVVDDFGAGIKNEDGATLNLVNDTLASNTV